MRVLRPPGLSSLYRAQTIAGLVVAADLLTKRWASTVFAEGPRTVIEGVLWFRFAENSGAAFSLFQNAGPWLGMAAVVVLGVVMNALTRPRPLYEVVGFGLVMGGALGNLSDRIFRGAGFLDGRVVDWIQLLFIPTFNLADAAINVGVAALLMGSWIGSWKRA